MEYGWNIDIPVKIKDVDHLVLKWAFPSSCMSDIDLHSSWNMAWGKLSLLDSFW